jgi:hypothetical protein
MTKKQWLVKYRYVIAPVFMTTLMGHNNVDRRQEQWLVMAPTKQAERQHMSGVLPVHMHGTVTEEVP